MRNLGSFLATHFIAAALLAIIGLMLPLPDQAKAQLFSGYGAVSPPAGLVTTLVLANNTGSIIPANSITPMFAQAGKQGDIPNACSGSSIILKLHSDNAVLPFSESVKPVCWNDGSLQTAAFIARDPESIPAATQFTLGASGHAYTNATGIITITLPSTPTYGTYLGNVTLSGLTGTGQFAKLDGTWPVISVSGNVLTIGGPVAVGTSTITGGTVTQPTYIQVDVYNGGTTPAASSRTTADYTAGGLDLNQQVVGLDSQLTGTWESDLGQGITSNGTTKYMDGAVGRVDMVWADFQQSGASHKQLEGRWYVAALQDSSGGLAGVRYLIRTTAPWYCAPGGCGTGVPAPNFWSFSSIGDYNGVSLINNPWQAQPTNFTWNSSNSFAGTTNTWATGMLLRLTNSGGSLPTGLSTNTTYFTSVGSQPPYFTTSFLLYAHSAASVSVPATTQCAGTCTATPYPYITQFGSLFDAQANGRWNYIQGNGSIASDPQIQVIPNMTYLRSTKLIPPYNFNFASTYPITEPAAYPFSMMTMGPIYAFSESTSDRGDIGPLTQWGAIYFFNQTPTDEENVRTLSYIGGQLPFNFRDITTHEFPCLVLTANCPTGLATNLSATGFTWQCTGAGQGDGGFTEPTSSFAFVASFGECNTSHMPDFAMAAFLTTGEPQDMEMLEERANEAVYQSPGSIGTAAVGSPVTSIYGNSGSGPVRNLSVNGTTYYGTTLVGGNIMRQPAWATRNLAEGVMASRADPACANCSSYFDSMLQNGENASAAYISMLAGVNTWVTNNGMWNEGQQNSTSWTLSYYINAWALAATWSQDGSGISNFLNYLVKWPAHINSTFGTSYVGYFAGEVRQDPASAASPFQTGDSFVAFQHVTLSWPANSTSFTYVSASAPYTPANGDMVLWAGASSCPDNNDCAPAGVTAEIPYYWCNLSGGVGNLSSVQGSCNPANFATPTVASVSTTAGPNFYATSLLPPYNVGGTYINGHGYASTALASLQFVDALGLSVDAATITDLSTEIVACNGPTSPCATSNYPIPYQADPMYLWQTSF